MNYIGLSGKQQSGKSTVADYLRLNLGETLIWGFGTEVKWEFLEENELNLTMACLDRQNIKESVLGEVVIMDKVYKNMSIRDALCKLGLDRRKEDPDYWVQQWTERMGYIEGEGLFETVIAPDVRFPNEVKAIRDIVIRLTRNPTDSNDPTETALDDYEFEHTIDNDVLTINETNEICLLTVKGYFNE